jgi:hypothetical protein
MANQEEGKPIVLRALPTEQSASAGPVIAAPHLPMMEKVSLVETVQRNPLLPLMGAGAPVHTSGEGTMARVPWPIAPQSALPSSPQEPKVIPHEAAPSDGYIRMEVHVENGQLSIVRMKSVPGPLALPSAVARGYVYEVLVDGQQVALGSVPDVGVRRAFANSDVPGPQGKHHFVDVPTFDFFVRVPKGYVSTANLPKLNIVLHNVREAPDRLTTLAPLQKQVEVEADEVGRISGIKLEELTPAVRSQLEQILKES